MLWLNILRKVRGITFKTKLGLFLSALIDVCFCTAGSSLATLPRVYVSGIIYAKSYGVYFYVRGFSDDLYSVMPGREGDINELILSCLKEGDVFLDVGANIGYYSVLAGKKVGESGRVISVEPVSSTARVLNLNLKLNGLKNVKIIQKATWSSNQILTLHMPEGFFGLASVHKPAEATDSFVIRGVPLDDISEALKVNLLKIDAEGSEYQILKGAKKTLKKTRYVILETSTKKDEIICFLKEEGFKIRKLNFTTYMFAYK
jgi:FkbM family methyltransferase